MKMKKGYWVYKLSLVGTVGTVLFGLILAFVNLIPMLMGTWCYDALGLPKEPILFGIGVFIFLVSFGFIPYAVKEVNEHR